MLSVGSELKSSFPATYKAQLLRALQTFLDGDYHSPPVGIQIVYGPYNFPPLWAYLRIFSTYTYGKVMATHIEVPPPAPTPSEAKQEDIKATLPPNNVSNAHLPTRCCQLNDARAFTQSLLPTSQSKPHTTKSWRAPILMLLSFLFAIMLAILHNAMNRGLSGNAVNPDGPWSQQWVSRYGVALAYLVRMLFVTCAGTAFVQKLWLDISTHQQVLVIRNLNVLLSVLSNPFSLVSRLWLQNPLLFATGWIAWTLPFAAIVTPGTLLVESRPHMTSASRTALQITSDSVASIVSTGTNFANGTHNTESEALAVNKRLSYLAFVVAASSRVLPVRSEFANQTFLTSFVGPVLKCSENTNSSMRTEAATFLGAPYLLEYLTWIGDNPPWGNSTVRYNSPSFGNYTFLEFIPEIFDSSARSQTEYNYTLRMITAPFTAFADLINFSMIECQLWNASYNVKFVYQNFEQSTIIHDLIHQTPILTISTYDHDRFLDNLFLNAFPKAIMTAFASLVIGASYRYPQSTQRSDFILPNITTLNATQLCHLMENLFSNITLSLFSVPEFLYDPEKLILQCSTLTGTRANTTDTISTNITTWSNTYEYHQRDLLIAYGLSFLASLLCCGIGMYSFYKNGSSFQNDFSTYIRAAEGSDLDLRDIVEPGDTGASPLPKRLGDTTITMASRKDRR